jgi:hypothetical protein
MLFDDDTHDLIVSVVRETPAAGVDLRVSILA